MGPMRKDVLDKAAWAWVQTTLPSAVTDDHVHTAYRIRLLQCAAGNCRRNCRGNPRCLSALGQSRWTSEPVPSQTTADDDLNSRYKEADTYVGLKNLGATCYVNSLLQLWFHNLPFRKAMYKYRPEDDPDEQLSLMAEPPAFPATSVGHLQLLFARLQFGNQRFIDPSEFVHSLGLDTTLQQDAQEFSKLFISMLEDRLTHQSSATVRDLISQNFKGQYSYVTRCMRCGTESSQLSTFYELDLNIQGHKTLGDSLSEFLHEESLDGANRYFCNVCREKQDAKRSIKLRMLPPMLHLQLLRFVYDRTKGHKKKLNSFIQFPEKLDMSEYLGLPAGTLVYDLSAVLVHMGSSAYSGHYVAHIRDSTTGTWNKFNDEIVEKMEGKNLKLGSEDDVTDFVVKKPRVQRPAKGFLTSKNAYMLVYSALGDANRNSPEMTNKAPPLVVNESNHHANGEAAGVNGTKPTFDKEDLRKEMTEWGLHEHSQNLVIKFNEEFDQFIKEQQKAKSDSEAHDEVRREVMRNICLSLQAAPDEEFDFVPTEWLVKCLQEGIWEATKLGPSITKDLCRHNKLDPTKVTSTKCISSVNVNQLYENGTGVRLQAPGALCKECVVEKCWEMRLKTKLAADSKEVSNLLKVRLDEYHTCELERLKEESGKLYKVFVSQPINSVYLNFWKTLIGLDPKTYSKPAYWVGKRTLQSWRRSALNLAAASQPGTKSQNGNGIPVKKEKPIASSPPKRSQSPDSNDEDRKEAKRCKTDVDSDQEMTVSPANQGSLIQVVKKKIVSAMNPNESDSESEPHSDTSENGKPAQPTEDVKMDADQETKKEETEKRTKENKTEDEEEEDLTFNEDIVCPHGELSIDESKRRLVSLDVWKILVPYFPHVKEFPKDSSVCSACLSSALAGEAAKEMQRASATVQKDALSDLFYDRNRPQIQGKDCSVLLVNNIFLADWRKFIRDCGRCNPPRMILNSSLLCEHVGLLYHPFEDPEAASRLTAVSVLEWSTLEQFYAVDIEVRAFSKVDSNKIEFQPAVCDQCSERHRAERLQADMEARSHFERAKIWVRRIENPQGTGTSGSSISANAVAAPLIDLSDPEFMPPGIAVASTTAGSVVSQTTVPSTSSPAAPGSGTATPGTATSENQDNPDIRRSARSRRPRGDKEIIVSSYQTLRDLKIMIFKHFQVAPIDQHLTLDGRDLEDMKATLGDLNVYPEALLLLRVDEPTTEEFIKSSKPEEGFKGTGLLGR